MACSDDPPTGPEPAAAGEPESNAVERARWNDARYARIWPRRELLTSTVTPVLIEALSPQPGERILDVGCGGGLTTLELARLVGTGVPGEGAGAVTGADISAPLLTLARSRADQAGVQGVEFVAADVQTDQLAGAPFDAVTSQFGVMFFDRPDAAFANLHRQLRSGGRLCFACWRTVEENPWSPQVAVAGLVPAPPAPPPGRSPTGPFTLADPEWIRELLTGAGFGRITVTPHDRTAELPDDALLDDEQLTVMKVPAERMPEALEAKTRHLERFRVAPGVCRVPLAFHIVSALA